jgi:putative peptide zinc metalloprotease protein
VQLTPGTHLAVSMIPVGGASKEHPALFVVRGKDGEPSVAIVSDVSPDPSTADDAPATPMTTTSGPSNGSPDSTAQPVAATAFPFTLPSKPGPGGTQAVAVGTKDGGVVYDVAYALVTVKDGANVTNTNGAFAFASCNACTTVAVSFQVVLIIGRSAVIAPINAAGALNLNCLACLTTAIADQMVVTLKAQPTDELVTRLNTALQKIGAVSSLGSSGTPAAVAAVVSEVQKEIEDALDESGLVANPHTTTTTSASSTASTTTTAATTTAATTTAATTTSATMGTTTTERTTSAPSTTSATTTAEQTTTTETTTTTTPTTTAEPPATTTTG